jgi:hypothetical protein
MSKKESNFNIVCRTDKDIQGDYEYILFGLRLGEKVLFQTEDLEPLISIRDLASGEEITVEADRNSVELGEFQKLKLVGSEGYAEFHVASGPLPIKAFKHVATLDKNAIYEELISMLLALDRMGFDDFAKMGG